jgi:hypothetical protein
MFLPAKLLKYLIGAIFMGFLSTASSLAMNKSMNTARIPLADLGNFHLSEWTKDKDFHAKVTFLKSSKISEITALSLQQWPSYDKVYNYADESGLTYSGFTYLNFPKYYFFDILTDLFKNGQYCNEIISIIRSMGVAAIVEAIRDINNPSGSTKTSKCQSAEALFLLFAKREDSADLAIDYAKVSKTL